MALTTSINIRGEWTETGTDTGLRVPRAVHQISELIALASGTAANQCNLIWSDTRTLTATSEDLDLSGGLTDAFGTSIAFTEVAGMIIRNNTTTATSTLIVGGAAANAWEAWVAAAGDKVNVGPDGIFILTSPVDGYEVTAGTDDILKIDSGAATITYDIIIWGRNP